MDGPRLAHHHDSFSTWTCWRRSQLTRLLAIPFTLGIAVSDCSLQGQAADRPKLFRGAIAPKAQVPATNSDSSTDPRASAKSAPRGDRPEATVRSASGLSSPTENLSANPRLDSASISRYPRRAEPSVTNQMQVGQVEHETAPIDLPTALNLAGITSPEVLIAQQRVLLSTARKQLAAAQALPNLNIGTNFDSHTGVLQRASGNILSVQRSALYLGAGLNAVAAGSVNLPGLQYNLNVSETYFAYLVSRQEVERSWAAEVTQRNQILLQLSSAYCRLVQAQGNRAIRVQIRDEAAEIARITGNFAKIGQGRPADAERAATELAPVSYTHLTLPTICSV